MTWIPAWTWRDDHHVMAGPVTIPTAIIDRPCGDTGPHVWYRCTRLADHRGRHHAASQGGRVWAVW